MMLRLSCLLVFLFHLSASETPANPSLNSSTPNGNGTVVTTSTKSRILPGSESINNAFGKMDRNTVIRAVIVLAGITGLVLMYVGIKTFLLRKKTQPRRYTLINNPTAMQQPLFGANDDDEDEIEDDTLFVRK